MKTLNILIICISLIGCKRNINVQNKIKEKNGSTEIVNKGTTFDFDLGDFILSIDADEEDFEITKKTDTIYIKKSLYKSLEGASLKTKKTINLISVEEEFIIGFKQSTIDDNPATALDINITKKIETKTSTQYNLLEIKTLKKELKSTYFNEIKNKSIKFQRLFYKKLLKNKDKYVTCCDEYIIQAENFLNKKEQSFDNFDKLNISPFIKSRDIKLKYKKDKKIKELIIFYISTNN